MKQRIFKSVIASLFVTTSALVAPALAEGAFEASSSIGYSWITGNELVYNNNGDQISKLVWESNTPVLGLNFAARFGGGYTLDASADFAVGSQNHMVDYDWLEPFRAGFGADQWTDRSIHPDTDLNKYLNIGIALGHDFAVSETATVNLHGGFKYRDIKWTAKGGSFVYSSFAFRDTIGDFTPGEPGISYQQTMPTVFVGINGKTEIDAWTLSGQLRGGVTVNATDQDFHFARDLLFDEKYGPIPYVAASVNASYKLNDTINLFGGADFEHYFTTKGDTTVSSISTRQVLGVFPDGAGMDFTSITLKGGLSVAF